MLKSYRELLSQASGEQAGWFYKMSKPRPLPGFHASFLPFFLVSKPPPPDPDPHQSLGRFAGGCFPRLDAEAAPRQVGRSGSLGVAAGD